MADSDPEYEFSDEGDNADDDVEFSGAGEGRNATYGTRRAGGTVSRTGGISRTQADGRLRRGRERWEASAIDRGGLMIGEEGGDIGRDLERLKEAGMRKSAYKLGNQDEVLEAVQSNLHNSLLGIETATQDLSAHRQQQAIKNDTDRRRRLRQDTQPVQRGIIRHLVLVLDLSEAMLEKDMRPNRCAVTLKHAQEYVREFFEQNPISQMCVLAMYDGLCIRISELSGNPNDHITAIREIRNPRSGLPREPKGSPSLQNALDMARGSLYHTPKHGTREVVLIFGALRSLDPGDINKTIRECVKDRLRVNIIGMSASVRICQEICTKTNAGDESCYTVATDAGHFRDLLMLTTTPPVIRRGTEEEIEVNKASLLRMGFPSKVHWDRPTLCACHGTPVTEGYTCGRCKAEVCKLPITCPSCGLTLILSTHLARSYHHLFPLRNWITVSWQRAREVGSVKCKSCLSPFPPIPPETKGKEKAPKETDGQVDPIQNLEQQAASESSRYECESCGHHFCIDCDIYCHEEVHNCPGCLSATQPPPMAVNGENSINGHNEEMAL